MRRAPWVLATLVVALVLTGFGRSAPVRPGGKIGTMTLVRGTSANADLKFFDFCDPVILKPADVHRRCVVPRVRRLFIGYGNFEPSRKALDADWKRLKWNLWLDRRAVDLARFGTSDRTLFAFPPAGGKDVILREWRVMLVGITPGKHTLRYRSRAAAPGSVTDAIWSFRVS